MKVIFTTKSSDNIEAAPLTSNKENKNSRISN